MKKLKIYKQIVSYNKNSLQLLINLSLKNIHIEEYGKIENIQTNSIISISKGIQNIKIDVTTLKNKQIKENVNIKNDLDTIKRIAFENGKKLTYIDKKCEASLINKIKKTNKILMFILINCHIEFYIRIGI